MNTPTAQARFLDVHILQTLPYSNVNRDDLGSPKTVTYGGTTRTRVSSQAWKRPTRKAVEELIGEKALRTRRLPLQVSTLLTQERGWPADLAAFAGAQVVISTDSKLALDKERDKADQATASLLFLPASAATRLADLAEEHRAALEKAMGTKAATKPVLPKDAVHEVLRSRNGSIALFGRMLAEIPGAGVDGAVQVAHAFTTHGTSVQGDFFTAVDDVDLWAAGRRKRPHEHRRIQQRRLLPLRHPRLGRARLLGRRPGLRPRTGGGIRLCVHQLRAGREEDLDRSPHHPGPRPPERPCRPARLLRRRVREARRPRYRRLGGSLTHRAVGVRDSRSTCSSATAPSCTAPTPASTPPLSPGSESAPSPSPASWPTP